MQFDVICLDTIQEIDLSDAVASGGQAEFLDFDVVTGTSGVIILSFTNETFPVLVSRSPLLPSLLSCLPQRQTGLECVCVCVCNICCTLSRTLEMGLMGSTSSRRSPPTLRSSARVCTKTDVRFKKGHAMLSFP